MKRGALRRRESRAPASAPGAEALVQSLPEPLLVLDGEGRIRSANPAAEQFFRTGATHLIGTRFESLLSFGHPLLDLIGQARAGGTVYEYGIEIGTPRYGFHTVNVMVCPIAEAPGTVAIWLQERAIAQLMDRQLMHRGAARSVSGMAAVLAHEVKNPLSGIRGAAQLLEQAVGGEDQALARLIRDESDRICALVDRMETFADRRPLDRGPVNIHEVLEHVRRIAEAGFGRGKRVVERYDPSLPPVLGARDRLVQAFLNLIKNACEAAPEVAGEIVVGTAYRHGVRLAQATRGRARLELPIEVTIQDNGGGVPEDIREHLFDPFVSAKAGGTGLGLAMVAKIVEDHGGVVEWDSQPGRTAFRVRLPVWRDEGAP